MFKNIITIFISLLLILVLLPISVFNSEVEADDTSVDGNYLTFTAQEAGSTIKFSWKTGKDVMICTNGTTWVPYTANTVITLTNVNDKVMFKGLDVTSSTNHYFVMTGKIAGSGDVTSLTNGVGGNTDSNHPLTKSCYSNMFYLCDSLTSVPNLPSTTLAPYCYESMYYGCLGLTTLPNNYLPALSLCLSCYYNMFRNCKNLATIPSLPATRLVKECYYYMFAGCISLETPADMSHVVAVDEYCCSRMYYGCLKLNVKKQETTGYHREWKVQNITEVKYWSLYMFMNTGTSMYDVSVDKTYYIKDQVNYDSIVFTSDASFSINPQAKNWNGTLYYSPDGKSFKEWDASILTAVLSDGSYKLYLRGSSENTVISNGTPWILTATNGYSITCAGNIETLRGATGSNPSSTTMADNCYKNMFAGCTSLVSIPNLTATTLSNNCYEGMFSSSGIKVSTDKVSYYVSDFRIPTSGSVTVKEDSLKDMFTNTTGTFTGTPDKEKTYYLCVQKKQTLTYGESVVNKTYGDQPFFQILRGNKTKVTYSSSNESVAIVNASTGEVTILKIGNAIIKASAEATNEYLSAEASYTINVATLVVDVPKAKTNLKYDGTKQTGVVKENDYYSLTDNENVNAGNYDAKAELVNKISCVWKKSPSTTEDQIINWTISKRNLSLVSESASKNYDGQPLQATSISVIGDGFAKEEGVTCETPQVIGNPKGITKIKNTISYTFNDGTLASNYIIGKTEGYLTVIGDKDEGDMSYDIDNGFTASFVKGEATVLTAHIAHKTTSSTISVCEDSEELPTGSYTKTDTTSNSLKINFQTNYLNNLSFGIHILVITVDDMQYKVSILVCENTTDCITFSSTDGFTIEASDKRSWDGYLYYSTNKTDWELWSGYIDLIAELDPTTGVYNLYLCGDNNSTVSNGHKWIFKPKSSNLISCTGDIETLRGARGGKPSEITMSNNCYANMFDGCESLITAPTLSSMWISNNCYYEMFKGCINLISAPNLPATYVSRSSYTGMFENCTSLDNVPIISAVELDNNCFERMFKGCTRITEAPELNAKYLSDYCYKEMFAGCTSLVSTPELNSKSLAYFCYEAMFKDCNNLVTITNLPAITLADYCYKEMFAGCSKLVTVQELPAKYLADSCYYMMFKDCTGLVSVPELKAETIAKSCYSEMFMNCSDLVSIPKDYLPIDVLEEGCYKGMFKLCSKLINTPELLADTLVDNCYEEMFAGCVSLVNAYNLQATSLEEACYKGMFSGCTSLTKVPELPATTLASHCYENMFLGCINIEEAPELPATILKECCYKNMFKGCTSLMAPADISHVIEVKSGCLDSMYFNCSNMKVYSSIQEGYAKSWKATNLSTTSITDWSKDMFTGTSGDVTSGVNAGVVYYIKGNNSDYLTFSSEGSFTLSTQNKTWDGSLFYSIDNENWYVWDGSSISASLVEGSEKYCLYLYGDDNNTKISDGTSWILSSNEDKTISCTGNIETLRGAKANNPSTTIMANNCYKNMFKDCTKLDSAPSLPATSLSEACYQNMFAGCTNLEIAPNLPATALTNSCYESMFYGCSKITIFESGTEESVWIIPCSSTTATDWGKDMLTGTSGEYTGQPQLNYVYHQMKNKKKQFLSFDEAVIKKNYGDQAYTQAVQGAKTPVTYASDNELVAIVNEITGQVKIMGIGTARIFVYAEESAIYEPALIYYTLEVDKGKVSIPVAKTDLVYDGMEQTGVELPISANYTLTGNKETNAGNYTAVATLKDKNNYVWDLETPTSDDQSISWSIAKAKVTVPSAKTNLKYNGQQQTGVELPYGGYYNLSNNKGTNAGDYIAVASLIDNKNYIWDLQTPTSDDQSIPWSIAKAKVSVPSAKTNLKYNGQQQTGVELPISANYTLTGNKETNAGNYTAVATLKDKQNYVWDLETPTSDNQSIPWFIEKRNITFTSASAYKKYDGQPLKAETVTVSGDGFVSGEGASYKDFSYTSGNEKSITKIKNYFDYSLNQGTDYKNYNITAVYGYLTVIASKKDPGDMDYDEVHGFTASYTVNSAPILTAHITIGSPSSTITVKDKDGNALKRDSDYTATDGSVKINFQPSYLNKLSVGTYSFDIDVNDMSYKATIIVTAKPTPPYVPVPTSTK